MSDWEVYEHKVRQLLTGKLFRWFPHLPKEKIIVYGKKVCTGAKGSYEIDASAEVHLEAMMLTFLVECKHWDSAVNQDKVLALVPKLQDLGAHKGIIVSKCGFQSGAKRLARANGIALWRYDPDRRPRFHPLVEAIDWEVVVREFETKWLSRLRKIEYQGYKWICHDNLYPWREAPLTLGQRYQMLLRSYWPVWLPLLAYGAIRDQMLSIRNQNGTS